MKTKHIQKFVNALISGQVALHYFEELTHTPFYQKGTKNKLNLLMKELRRNEKVFEAIQNEAENATDDVHDSFFQFMNMVTSIPFHESGNASKVLEAYLVDPKRMEQITKKIFEDEKRRFLTDNQENIRGMKTESRELKFRVWDDVDYMSSHFTLQDIQKGRVKFTSECTVMQFTGLTDKNGNEIYEGDILPMKFDHPQTEGVKYGNEFTLNGVVEYDLPHQAKYKISFPDNKHEIISCEFGWGSMPDLEVIGNIHENPELIE